MFLKRFFDIVMSMLGLVVLSPLFLVIAILIKMTSTGPVFFKQKRVGRFGVPFWIYKFRTMVVNAEAQGLKITVGHDRRITPIGYFLRKTKLDELPQLWNVFIGDMSLVGPRPEVPEYVAIYPESLAKIVLSVRPGITDWASILMIDENDILANSTNPEETYTKVLLPRKLDFAVEYVKTRSFTQDLKLIFKTLSKIITR